MRSPTAALPLAEGQREVLEEAVRRSQTARHRDVQRARALLLAADGIANTRIGADLGVSPTTVRNWRERFAADGLGGIGVVRPGRGRKASIPPEKVAAIVHATLHEKPEGETHWSCRTISGRLKGVSPATVQRIWSARELKPHRVKTFKSLLGHKRFEEKLVDVVGLYLNPPDKMQSCCAWTRNRRFKRWIARRRRCRSSLGGRGR